MKSYCNERGRLTRAECVFFIRRGGSSAGKYEREVSGGSNSESARGDSSIFALTEHIVCALMLFVFVQSSSGKEKEKYFHVGCGQEKNTTTNNYTVRRMASIN